MDTRYAVFSKKHFEEEAFYDAKYQKQELRHPYDHRGTE